MNKQTRSFRNENTSTRVGKGVSVYTGKGSNAVETGALRFVTFPDTKGRCVNSSKEREAAGKKPWQGARARKSTREVESV